MNSSYRLFPSLRWLMLARLCLLLSASFAGAQTAPAPSPADAAADTKARPVAPETASSLKPLDKETVVLSPFEVVSNNRGYYGGNTMSGTRFNSKIEDLASAITVVTKEQMTDFAMLDINDIFLYAAGTEGSGTYTDFTVDRNGSVSDNVQLNPTQANRIRGIAPANISLNNIETMGRVPIDPIGIDAVEISRGPNANVFGLGNPSGTVNMVPSSANLTHDRAEVVFRGDSYGGYRDSIDANKVLIKDKLAIRGSQVFEHEGFIRKPSGVDTERYNGMIKYQPFKNTTISAWASYYHSYGTRPNSLPPRDNISYWVQNGKPTWDPVTRSIHVNGTTIGPIDLTAGTGNFPATFKGPGTNGATINTDYFSSSLLGGNHNQMFIDQTGLAYWAAPQDTINTTPLAGVSVAGPTSLYTDARYLQTTGAPGASGTAAKPSGQPLFTTTPTISDKSIYDWSSTNISSVNRLMDKTHTYNITLDQVFFNTPMQMLVGQAAFMREDAQRYQRNLVGAANDNGQSGQLQVDINERLLDGTPNPFFLRPFIATDKPRDTSSPSKWDTSRGQLAYKVDFAEAKSDWAKWLGMHTITGYSEYKYRVNRVYSYRDALASPNPWIPVGVARGNQGAAPAGTPANILLTQGLYRFYVGDNQGQNVDYAPTPFQYGNYPFVWVQSNAANAIVKVNSEPSLLEQVASTDGAGGTFNNKTVIRTNGAVIQSHFLQDHFVATLGTRQDNVLTKFGATPTLLPDGINYNYATVNGWENHDWRTSSGRTNNVQFVLRPFTNEKFVTHLDHDGESGHFFAELLNGLSFNYNNSGSFLVAAPAQDIALKNLPNPTGHDKSWGMGLNLFGGKIVVRATRFDDLQKDARGTDLSTLVQRVTRIDISPTGQTPNPARLQFAATNWVTALNPSFSTQQVQDEVAKEIGLSTALQNQLVSPSVPFAATSDVEAKGTEIEINFNPTRFWTVAASVTDLQTYQQNVSTAMQDWIDQRMKVWTTIQDPTIPKSQDPAQLWWNHLYPGATGGQTPSLNFLTFVQAPYNLLKQQEGKSNPEVRRYNARVSTSFQLAGITDNKILKRFNVGGALRWEDKGAIGYYGIANSSGVYIALDGNRPIYDKGHYFLDAFVSYKTKFWGGKIPTTIQFNARNIQESGHLQPVGAFPDGTISTYRIVDPREFILQATFDL